MKRAYYLVSLLLIALPSVSNSQESRFNPAMADSPTVNRMFSYVESHRNEIIDEWKMLTEIPAPSGHEEKRAQYIEKELEALGLEEVYIDPAGNVIGIWKGTPGGKKIIFAAHMDTVFKDLRAIKVRREGNLLKAPGIADDSAGLIHLLWMVRALKHSGFRPTNTYYFIGTVKEELGVVGMRAFMDSTEEQFDHVIAIDGNLGEVEIGALGIHGRKVIFSGPGAHTLQSRGVANPNLAVAKAVERIFRIEVPDQPPEKWTVLNVGQIEGGKVTNAVSQESFFTVDLRSVDQAELDKALEQVETISRAVATETGVQLKFEVFEDSKAAQIPGARDSVFVRTVVEILEFLEVENIELGLRGSTDACVGIEKGILSVNIGRTYGRFGHTLREEAEIEGLFVALKQVLLLIYSLE